MSSLKKEKNKLKMVLKPLKIENFQKTAMAIIFKKLKS